MEERQKKFGVYQTVDQQKTTQKGDTKKGRNGKNPEGLLGVQLSEEELLKKRERMARFQSEEEAAVEKRKERFAPKA